MYYIYNEKDVYYSIKRQSAKVISFYNNYLFLNCRIKNKQNRFDC